MTDTSLPGYDYGSDRVAASPVSDEEFEQLKIAVLWS